MGVNKSEKLFVSCWDPNCQRSTQNYFPDDTFPPQTKGKPIPKLIMGSDYWEVKHYGFLKFKGGSGKRDNSQFDFQLEEKKQYFLWKASLIAGRKWHCYTLHN